jgi:hypothetical protein
MDDGGNKRRNGFKGETVFNGKLVITQLTESKCGGGTERTCLLMPREKKTKENESVFVSRINAFLKIH